MVALRYFFFGPLPDDLVHESNDSGFLHLHDVLGSDVDDLEMNFAGAIQGLIVVIQFVEEGWLLKLQGGLVDDGALLGQSVDEVTEQDAVMHFFEEVAGGEGQEGGGCGVGAERRVEIVGNGSDL